MTKGSSFFYLQRWISVIDGRFPRAWPQPPRRANK